MADPDSACDLFRFTSGTPFRQDHENDFFLNQETKQNKILIMK